LADCFDNGLLSHFLVAFCRKMHALGGVSAQVSCAIVRAYATIASSPSATRATSRGDLSRT